MIYKDIDNNDQKKKSFSVGLTIYICLVYLIYFWLLHAGVGAAFVAYGFTPVLICINAIIISVILVVGKTHSIIVTNVINIIIGLITYVLLLVTL